MPEKSDSYNGEEPLAPVQAGIPFIAALGIGVGV